MVLSNAAKPMRTRCLTGNSSSLNLEPVMTLLTTHFWNVLGLIDLQTRGNPPKNTQIKQNPLSKDKAKTGTGSTTTQPQNKQKALLNSAKLKLSEKARKELYSIGVHGKARKDTIEWHKYQLKQQMSNNPALKGKGGMGIVEHIAHMGGSNPKEKNHITASFRDKYKEQIPNNFNGGKNHHLYVNNKGLPLQAKLAMNKNNAEINGQSKSHQTSVSTLALLGRAATKEKASAGHIQRHRAINVPSDKCLHDHYHTAV
ncbi:hypothetical protein BDZ97DRAFT_2054324 [Flammula alnicola]|nr:hypothetical protein BDZ97DRAFT_2054324 [Flammula alnicola]